MQTQTIQVLLADDDENDCLLFQDAFKEIKLKTEVQIVNDGIALMKHLTKPGVSLPHVLFLDLNMPRKSGLECLKEIKTFDNLKDIAIAIYSTSASEEDIEETFVNGANIYINKPNNFNALKKVLQEAISTNWQYHTSGLNKDNFLLSL